MKHLVLDRISIQYQTNLLSDFSITIGPGWTGISGPNGCGKTTLARYVISRLAGKGGIPGCSGTVKGPGSAVYVPQSSKDVSGSGGVFETGDIAADIAEILYSSDNYLRRIISMLSVGEDWPYRLDELSYGELRRLQLLLVLSRLPEVLILDEPENHLDGYTRRIIADVLDGYSGIGIIIGHNREIMNRLCTSTVLIRGGRCHVSRTGLSDALRLYRERQESLRTRRRLLSEQIRTQKALLGKMNNNAAKAGKALSKKGVTDADGKEKIDRARVSGADKSSGRKVGLQKKIIASAESQLAELQTDALIKTGITAKGVQTKRDRFVHIRKGRYRVNPGLVLDLPEFQIRPGDRIVLSGRNGSGKTSLLRYILGGCLAAEPPGFDWRYVPQELSPGDEDRILQELAACSDRGRGDVMAFFSRLGGDAGRQSGMTQGSPGELRKLLFSLLFIRETRLLFLDEPTNHMDIFAVEVIEDALKNYEGALLFVSHDIHFAEAVAFRKIRIENGRAFLSELPGRQ